MRITVASIMFVLGSCAGGDVEGDEAFECSDGADNDQNGYFDCDDLGCWNSPDCDGESDTDTDTDTDTDADADADSDTDTDTDTGGPNCDDGLGPFTGLNSVDMTMVLNVDIDETNAFCSYLQSLGAVSDCEMTWEGQASTVLERCRPPERITFQGNFSRTASTCDPNPNDSNPGPIEQATWGNNDGNTAAYMSFIMDADDPGFMYAITAHEASTRWEPIEEDPATQKQYAVYNMASYEYASGQMVIDYSEVEQQTLENCPHTFTSSVYATFNGN